MDKNNQLKRMATYKLRIEILDAMEEYTDQCGMTKSAFLERAIAYYIRNHELQEDSDIEYLRTKRLKTYNDQIISEKSGK